jgi:hypothetical protein
MNTFLKSVLAVSVVAAPSLAATIRLDTSSYSHGHGGEFTATVLTGNVGITGDTYSLSGDSLQTFCVQADEFFHPGDTLTAVVNTVIVQGHNGDPSNPLDPRTAFLYSKFRDGSLAAMGYDYAPAARPDSAGDLQEAIWFLQGESGGVSNAFVAAANIAVASGGEWFGVGLGNVRVLNLFNPDGSNAQDQLTIVPGVPGATALGLIGLTLFARRRR